ncbi:MAG: hypothetical protein PHI37_00745 [Candidatus Gracilibacteria bacterium]|nr:hypothetical protein [Candidatus Gracilibacteria bacterium]
MTLLGVNKNDIQSFNDDNYGRNKEYFKSQPDMMKEMAKYARENLARINKDLSEGKDIDGDFKRELEKFLAEYEKIEDETKESVKQAHDAMTDIEKKGKKETSRQSKNEKYNFSTIENLSDNLTSLEGLNTNDVLTVSIKDSNSKLRLRDNNQKIIDRLNQGTEVVLTGNYKEIEGKVFVEVKNGDKKGWIALGYLRKEVATSGNTNEDKAETTGDNNIVPNIPTSTENPQKQETSIEKNNYTELVSNINNNFEAWKLAINDAAGIKNEDEIKEHLMTINIIYKELAESIIAFENQFINGNNPLDKNVKQNKEWIKSMYNEIALYNRGETNNWVSIDGANKNFRNPLLAEELLLSLLPKQNKEIPKRPDLNNILESLDDRTKTLFKALLKKEEASGLSFEEAFSRVLSNSTIKGAWDKIIDKLGEGYDDKMEEYLNSIDRTTLSNQEKKAYDQLIDMKGLGSFYDFKDENKFITYLGRDQLIAISAGIAGAVFTATGVGAIGGGPLLAYSAAALAGGVLTTGASIAMNQKTLSGKDFAFETAINSGTFLVGGLIFKVARSGSVISKIGTKGAIGAEATSDVTLGISIDQIRAKYQGVDVSLAESLKDNLTWALLPIVSGGIASRMELATKTKNAINEANIKQTLGDNKGAESVLKNIDEEISLARSKDVDSKKIDLENINSLEIGKRIKVGEKYITRTKDGKFSYDGKKYENADELINVVNGKKTQVIKEKKAEGEKVETKDSNKKSKEKKKESKSENLKKYNEKIESIEKKLKGISDFGSKIDQRLSNLPFLLDKPYTFLKWFVHNGNNFRYIPREIGNSLITPKILIKDLPKNLSEGQYKQAIKNVLFSSNDITWRGGVMKIGAYFTIPFTIEEIYKFNTVEGYEWGADKMSDAAITIAQDGISNMYLGVINSMIIEYLNDNTFLEQ